MVRSHRSGADGVVNHDDMIRNIFRGTEPRSTTPSAPSKEASRHFLDVSSTPPHEEGSLARLKILRKPLLLSLCLCGFLAAADAQQTMKIWDGIYTAEQAKRGKAEFD